MEKKGVESRIIIILIFISIVLLVIPSIIYIKKLHQDNLRLVLEKNIIEVAEKCYYEEKCKNKVITLEELQEKEYLDKIYDPVTKELISNKSYVSIDAKEFKIVE